MNIHKIGHCCLIIEEGNTRLMTDPGNLTDGQLSYEGLEVILITHTHPDHLDMDSIGEVASKNPDAVFIGNTGIKEALLEKDIVVETIPHGEEKKIKDISIKAFDAPHEHIYESVPVPENTGYLINETLYIPGDSYTVPDIEVPVLAVPVSAPWGTIGSSIDYIKAVNPKKAFPIHDGMLSTLGPFHQLPAEELHDSEIEFTTLKSSEDLEI